MNKQKQDSHLNVILANMCRYVEVNYWDIDFNKDNSINRFMKKDSKKHFPAEGEASLSGVIVTCNLNNGLAKNVETFIFGGELSKN